MRPHLQVNKTYTFSKIGLKMTNSKYNSTKCPYEMSVGDLSIIEVCDDMDAPKICFTFVGIDKLEEKINKNCDVIGIVQEVTGKNEIQLKNGKGSKEKRNVVLVDQSGKQVSLTLWDSLADELLESHASANDVVAIRSVRVGDYQGCSLNTTRSSIIQVNPELPEAAALKVSHLSSHPAVCVTYSHVGIVCVVLLCRAFSSSIPLTCDCPVTRSGTRRVATKPPSHQCQVVAEVLGVVPLLLESS